MLAGYFNLAQREIKQIEIMNDTIVKTETGFYVIPEKVMELKQAVKILKDHNAWRRDNISSIPISRTTRSKELGIAIDVVVDHLTD